MARTRTLILYVVGHDLVASMIDHDDALDQCDDRHKMLDAIPNFEEGNATFIELNSGDFRPLITDENGDEIAMSFVTL